MCDHPSENGFVLPGLLVLGPMAGVTDHPFRQICREMGAALVSTEMVSANAVKYGNKKTKELIDIGAEEHPVSMQLFGPDPETFRITIDALAAYPYDILDINMGCPMPKIVKNGEGSALMLAPDKAEGFVRASVRASDRPVTVKMRAGFHEGERTAVELAKRAEAAGAAAVAVHGRTREQYYAGKADWSIIRDVKNAVRIPVIGNGDVNSAERAGAMMAETGCDYVMIGRASQGNPWIFREAAAYLAALKGGKSAEEAAAAVPPRPAVPEIHAMMLRHAEALLKEKGETLGVLEMRKHIAWYTTGLPGSAALRAGINAAADYPALKALLDQWLSESCKHELS